MFSGEIPQDLGLFRRFDIFIGCKMIRHQDDFVPIDDLRIPQTVEF